MRWLSGIGNGNVVLARGRETKIIIAEVDADVVLGEPGDSVDKVIIFEGGEIVGHDFHVTEAIHGKLGCLGDGARGDGAAIDYLI